MKLSPCPWCALPPRARPSEVACENPACPVGPRVKRQHASGPDALALWNRRAPAANKIALEINEEDGTVARVVTEAPAEVYFVCDFVPADRIYLLGSTHITGPGAVERIIGGSPVGHYHDGAIHGLGRKH